ncbi:MAG: hypothetical protein V8S42_01240 [Lachnospiraceae bacterium]
MDWLYFDFSLAVLILLTATASLAIGDYAAMREFALMAAKALQRSRLTGYLEKNMSNVRDYLKEKREKRQQTEKTTGYREKIRGHKLAIFYGQRLELFWLQLCCSYISVEE